MGPFTISITGGRPDEADGSDGPVARAWAGSRLRAHPAGDACPRAGHGIPALSPVGRLSGSGRGKWLAAAASCMPWVSTGSGGNLRTACRFLRILGRVQPRAAGAVGGDRAGRFACACFGRIARRTPAWRHIPAAWAWRVDKAGRPRHVRRARNHPAMPATTSPRQTSPAYYLRCTRTVGVGNHQRRLDACVHAAEPGCVVRDLGRNRGCRAAAACLHPRRVRGDRLRQSADRAGACGADPLRRGAFAAAGDTVLPAGRRAACRFAHGRRAGAVRSRARGRPARRSWTDRASDKPHLLRRFRLVHRQCGVQRQDLLPADDRPGLPSGPRRRDHRRHGRARQYRAAVDRLLHPGRGDESSRRAAADRRACRRRDADRGTGRRNSPLLENSRIDTKRRPRVDMAAGRTRSTVFRAGTHRRHRHTLRHRQSDGSRGPCRRLHTCSRTCL